MSKKLFLAIFSITVIVGGFYLYKELTYVPQVFPLDNTKAHYKITKGCPAQSGGKEFGTKGMRENKGYCLEYRGDKIIKPLGTEQNFYRITIGDASQDLERFLNKEIIITSGQFVQGDKQCVQNQCFSLGGSSTLLNLRSISLQ